MLEAGADPNAARESGTTALIVAYGRGNPGSVSRLLESGADVDRLLESGADVGRKGPNGTSALLEAVDGGHTAIAQLLLDAGAR